MYLSFSSLSSSLCPKSTNPSHLPKASPLLRIHLNNSRTPKISFHNKLLLTYYDVLRLKVEGSSDGRDKITPEEKAEKEAAAMRKIALEVVGGTVGEEIMELFEEFEEGETPTARHLRDADKIEMLVQALEYERSEKRPLQDFWESTKGVFRTPFFKEVEAELRQRRSTEMSNGWKGEEGEPKRKSSTSKL